MVYLKHWTNHNRIPALTIDFRVKEAFPNSLKDCLDVYLWIRTAPENEIRSTLGYCPRKIVVVGESSGGSWAMSLALILNDLRRDYKSRLNFEIKVPDGLFLIYPPLLIQNCSSPSRLFSAFDVLYPKPWFQNLTRQQFADRIESFSKEETSPYLSPLFYDKFDDEFNDILINIVVGEFEIFLDDSITLAKLYKGRTKVDVMTDQCHRFLSNIFDTDRYKMFCANRLAEMFKEIH